jgi:hypothetical protein
MTSRYCYCPQVYRKLCRRITLVERIKRRFRRIEEPDMFPICGYNQPVFPGK